MRVIRSARENLDTLHICFTLVMCSIVLLLSSCSDLSTGTTAVSIRVTPSPTEHRVQAKSDSNSISTEALSRAELAKVQKIMANMTLDQKLGQLIVVEYLGNSYQGQDGGLQYMISQQFVGGFMYQESNHNFDPPYNVIGQLAAFSQRAMHDAKIPLMIATDQEGGLVNRLYQFHGYLPSAAAMAATGNPNVALNQGAQAAKWMLELGINSDFAPVVDVHTVDPPVLESRMFGRDPQTVATYAGAFLN